MEGLSLAIDVVKIFAIGYGLIATTILIYGIFSVITGQTRVFKDEKSSYGFSKSLTLIKSIMDKSISPFYYHRIIPHASQSLKGSPARLTGWFYIIIGLLMLAPLAWAVFFLK